MHHSLRRNKQASRKRRNTPLLPRGLEIVTHTSKLPLHSCADLKENTGGGGSLFSLTDGTVFGLSVTLSVFACFVFRLEQHKQGNTLTDE